MKWFSHGMRKCSLWGRWLAVSAFFGTAGFLTSPLLHVAFAPTVAHAADGAADNSTDTSIPPATDKSSTEKSDTDKSNVDKSGSDKSSTDKSSTDKSASPAAKSDQPADAAARRKTEEQDYEFYKSLADTIDQVERNYVKPIDRRELMEAAIKGVLGKLDPYSSYISPDEINGFRTTVESQFGGIGIQITPDDGQIKVSTPLVGTPAYKAGVLAGDHILRIEGESTRGLSLDDVVRRLKGEVGSPVSFTVRHASGQEETFTIQREIIHLDTVLGDAHQGDDTWNFMLYPDQRIGYIRLTAFSRDSAADLKKALQSLQQQKMRGLILDLRFNPGGLLTSAIEICNMFISEGRIVSTKGRNSPERVWDATPSTKFEGFPMVVLVNEYSASASEIVSACLQDHDRAVIIGERTWGKGSVQNVIDLEDGKSALKLTTATYTRPNGHNIHRFPDSKESDEWGVKPNDGYEVRLSENEMAAVIADRRSRDIVPGKLHEDKPPQTLAAATPNHTASSDHTATTDKPITDAHHDDDHHSDAHHDDAKSSTDDSSTDKNTHADKSAKSAATTDDSTTAKSSSAAKDKSTPSGHPKFTDRQLQKALEYLSTELARAQ